MLSGVQFTTPLGLLLLPCALFLIFAYLRKHSGSKKSVSSVIILKALRQHTAIRRRFKPPLSFFLEFLSLLLLALAAAQPLLRDSSARIAIIFDTSLSMQAKSGSTSRFELAQTATRRWIQEQSGDERFTVYATAPSLVVKTAQLVSRSAAQQGVGELTPAVATDAIPAAVTELGSSGEFDKLLVVTDRPVSFAETVVDSQQRTEIAVLPLEVSGENIYLSSSRIEQGTGSAQSVVIDANLSGATLRDATLALFAVGQTAPLSSLRISLRPGIATSVKFPLTSPEMISRGLRAEISSDTVDDVLPEDDTLWIASDTRGHRTITLVSDTLSAESSGLNSLPGFSVSSLTPREYQARENDQGATPALYIFHHTAPQVAPRVSALFILPPPQNSIFPILTEVTAPNITSWNSTHPLTTYARIPLIKLAAASVFETPPWAQAIVNVEQGALVIAGESEGFRFVGFGTEILPFEGQRTPTSSILFLNALRWLTGESELGASYTPGSVYALEGDASWVISEPSGAIATIESTRDKPARYQFANAGLYKLAAVSATVTSASASKSTLIAVNNLFPAESALYNGPALELPRMVEQQIEQKTSRSGLTAPLIWLAILLLLADLIIREFALLKSRRVRPPAAVEER